MGNRHDRLTKSGIVALAGIAVLGWMREPEKHQNASRPISVDSFGPTESRKTFYPPPTQADETVSTNIPERDMASVHPGRQTYSLENSAPTAERLKSPIKVHQRTSAVVKTPGPPQGNTGRHEDPQIIDDDIATRSRGPRTEGSENRHESEPPQNGPTPMPDAGQHDNTRAPTQAPKLAKKDRSTARSAAIILGTAAAGAAIGAAAGGGKGAAIGALSGGTGGFVYDRMTRHNNMTGAPGVIDSGSNSNSGADQQGHYRHYDGGPSLARRFGTPNFNGR